MRAGGCLRFLRFGGSPAGGICRRARRDSPLRQLSGRIFIKMPHPVPVRGVSMR